MKHIQTFEEWQKTEEGKKACDLGPFCPSLAKKNHEYIINRMWAAYIAGCEAVIVTMEPIIEQPRPLSPPEAPDPAED